MPGIPRSNRSLPTLSFSILFEKYGPDARDLRVMLRGAIGPLVDRIWAEGDNDKSAPFAAPAQAVTFVKKIQELEQTNEAQRALNLRVLNPILLFNTIAFGAVCSGARFASRAFSCNPYFLACDHFCKLLPVCTA